MTTVFLGLGSNIDAEKNLKACAAMLRAGFQTVMFSNVYKTTARDAEDQDDFLNAVARFDTDQKLADVIEVLRHIEIELGKDPPYPKGPRTIDIDILLWSGDIIESLVTIPHPRMHERRFVLEPLCELLDPRQLHPLRKTSWEQFLAKTADQGCEKTSISL